MSAPARIGVVLAGGRGRRIGGDKAAALLGDRTLLAHAAALVAASGLGVRVCARAGTSLPEVPEVDPPAVWREPATDGEPHPLGGLAHALLVAGEPVVALPVDLPLLPPALLTALATRPEPLVVLGLGGRPAALVVRTEPRFAAPLADAAAAGAPALRTLLQLGATVIDLAELAPGAAPARALFNVNTPGDLTQAARLLLGG